MYLLNSLYVCMVLQCVMHVKADDIYGFVFVEIHNPPLYFLLRFPLMLRFHFSSRPQRLWQIQWLRFPRKRSCHKQLQKWHNTRQINLILTYCRWFNIIPQTLQVVLFIHKTEHIYTLMRISRKYIFVFMIHTQETISYISSERLILNILGEE